MSQGGHVLVIGAGIVGVCTALELLAKGFEVTIVEPEAAGGPQAASYGNGAMLSTAAMIPMSSPGLWKKVPSYLLDREGPLVIRPRDFLHLLPWMLKFLRAGATVRRVRTIATALWSLLDGNPEDHAHLANKAGVGDLIERDGIIYAFRHRADYEAQRDLWALRRQIGLRWVALDGAELRALEPNLSGDYDFGILVPSSGKCADPGAYVAALLSHAVKSGARHLVGTALGFRVEDGRLRAVDVSGREWACDSAVVCAGLNSRHLAAAAGDKVPLIGERGYHVQAGSGVGGPSRPVMPMDGKMSIVSLRDGLRAAGQVELCRADARPNWDRAEILSRHLKRCFPASDTGGDIGVWYGARPSLPDCLPIISPASHVAGLVYAFGHGHIGLSAAPATARLVGDIIQGKSPDVRAFDVRRFGG